MYIIALLLIILYCFNFYKQNSHIILTIEAQVALLIMSLFLGYLIEEIFSEHNQTIAKTKKTLKNIYLELFFNNKKFRIYFWGFVIVKSSFLILITILYYQKEKYLPIFFIILFSSPIILFNYTLNNAFGFFNTFWLSINKGNLNGLAIFKIYINLLKRTNNSRCFNYTAFRNCKHIPFHYCFYWLFFKHCNINCIKFLLVNITPIKSAANII